MNDSPAPAQSFPRGLLERLTAARRWLVLTGSGLSAASGVPTFRDAQTGLWARYDVQALATREAFAANPALVWAWYRWRRRLLATVEPNAGHYALAELARIKPALLLVTQNVDGLQQRAGSNRVVEFHGNLARDRCFDCGTIAADVPDVEPGPPSCAHCSGLLRPDVVWFGEQIPADALAASLEAAAAAEVFLSIGTAARVYPAAGLAQLAADHGATVVELNTARTPLSDVADYRLKGSSADCLPALIEGLGSAAP